jgi:hypothetical protein
MLPCAFGKPENVRDGGAVLPREVRLLRALEGPRVGPCWHLDGAETSRDPRTRWEPRYRAYLELPEPQAQAARPYPRLGPGDCTRFDVTPDDGRDTDNRGHVQLDPRTRTPFGGVFRFCGHPRCRIGRPGTLDYDAEPALVAVVDEAEHVVTVTGYIPGQLDESGTRVDPGPCTGCRRDRLRIAQTPPRQAGELRRAPVHLAGRVPSPTIRPNLSPLLGRRRSSGAFATRPTDVVAELDLSIGRVLCALRAGEPRSVVRTLRRRGSGRWGAGAPTGREPIFGGGSRDMDPIDGSRLETLGKTEPEFITSPRSP